MKKIIVIIGLCLVFCMSVVGKAREGQIIRKEVPLDSIVLSDPAILADVATGMYYMTGTGGRVWKSPDLKRWEGPYPVTQTDPASWMGPDPMIWAAELHLYNGKYYYFGTFTNRDVIIDRVNDIDIERRACHILVSDHPGGPYVPMEDEIYLPADMPTLDGTFWIENGTPYMIYCYEWLQAIYGTMDMIELKPDLSGPVGESTLLFSSLDCPWSLQINADGTEGPHKVTDGPWLFRTQTGRLGMIWTSWRTGVYTQGVAYSESGLLAGPWVHEPDPITPPNYGHGMLFRTFEGQLLMSVHKHQEMPDGRFHRVPHFFLVDDSGDRLIVGERFIP